MFTTFSFNEKKLVAPVTIFNTYNLYINKAVLWSDAFEI